MKTRRIIAVLLALLVLVVSMSFTAFAADDGTITIRDSESGEQVASRTFNIYKIFNATTSGTAIAYQWYIPDGQEKSPYYDFFYSSWTCLEGTEHQPLLTDIESKGDSQERAAQYMRGLTADELMVLSIDLYDYIRTKGIAVTETKTAGTNDVNVQFTGLEYGYYLIYDATENPQMRAAVILTSVAPTSIVNLKAEKPAISKTFNGTQKTGSAVIGDTINYEISTLVPDHTFFTSSYTYNVTDIIPSSLTLDKESVVIKKGGEVLSTSDYTSSVEDGKIEVKFTNILNYTKGEKLTISYNAVLNDSTVSTMHTVNTATLTYSNDPSNLTSTGTTSSSTDIHTYYVELTKVAAENHQTVLPGAKFKFYRIVDGEKVALNLVQQAEGSYKVQVNTTGETPDVELSTTADGKLKIDGLAAGTYTLLETVAPDGYKLPLDDFEFTVTETFSTDGSSVLDGISMTNITTTNDFGEIVSPVGQVAKTEGGSDVGYITFKLTNAAGTELPATGGMGTTLFTFGGILLMAVALGFFTSKRRSEA